MCIVLVAVGVVERAPVDCRFAKYHPKWMIIAIVLRASGIDSYDL